jgi:hypothetical protein
MPTCSPFVTLHSLASLTHAPNHTAAVVGLSPHDQRRAHSSVRQQSLAAVETKSTPDGRWPAGRKCAKRTWREEGLTVDDSGLTHMSMECGCNCQGHRVVVWLGRAVCAVWHRTLLKLNRWP